MERQRAHESAYRRTVDLTLRNVSGGKFSPETAEFHVQQIRDELKQCADLLLISPEFYTEQMSRLEGAESIA